MKLCNSQNLKRNSPYLISIFRNYSPNPAIIQFTPIKLSPEWATFIHKLLNAGYFGATQFTARDITHIKNACVNFARDNYQLIRYLSPKHIVVLVESGCPSTERKIANSGKRLRAHLNIDERNVCGSCILRGNCERAFLAAREGEGARTVDVMRFLVEHGLDSPQDSVDNVPGLDKTVRESAKILLKEMVEFSSEIMSREEGTHDRIDALTKQGDWNCPKCSFLNFSRNMKCLRCDHLSEEKLRKLREKDEANLPPMKGDFICEKCTYLNFSKNSLCLRCYSKPPMRKLIPGEWECQSCYYINFRKNMVCLKCEQKRPMGKPQLGKISQPAGNNMGYRLTGPVFGELKHIDDGHITFGELKHIEDGHISPNFTSTNKKVDSLNQIPVFIDFPVLGGKSNLSRDVKKQERWKREMKLTRKDAKNDRENADDLESSMLGEPFHCSDDEQMADWFQKKPERVTI